MHWTQLTSPELENRADRQNELVVLPLGSLEEHGWHLPLGTDSLLAESIAKMAAEQEEAIVLPVLPFAFVSRQRTFPGTLTMDAVGLLRTLENICDEVARNGFRKILIFNAHGGNASLLDVFCRSLLNEEKDYIVVSVEMMALIREEIQILQQSHHADGHSGEVETSLMLYLHRDLVRSEELKKAGKGGAQKSYGLAPGKLLAGWAHELPCGFEGDPRLATVETGKRWAQACAGHLAELYRKVKGLDVQLAKGRHLPHI